MKHRHNDSNGNGFDVQRLISQAIEGDVDAFGKIYEAYMEPIYRYIFLRVGQRSASEMLTEDTFVEAWEALPQYRRRGADSFPIWIYRIARNVVIDYLYEHRQLPLLETYSEPEGVPDKANGLPSDLPFFSVPSPGSPLLNPLLDALHELNDMEQDVAILAFVEELPMQTIAHIVDRNIDACQQIQKRVLLKLVQSLRYQPLDDDER